MTRNSQTWEKNEAKYLNIIKQEITNPTDCQISQTAQERTNPTNDKKMPNTRKTDSTDGKN